MDELEGTVSKKVKPNHRASPGPIGNTQGLIVPQTQPNASGPNNSAPPPQSKPKEEHWWKRWGSEAVHTTLDLVGLIPAVGELADGANALVYLAEGDKINAALSAASMLPVGGQAATAAKWGKKVEKRLAKEAAEEATERSAKAAAEKAAKEKLEREAAEKARDAAAKKGSKKASSGNQGGNIKGKAAKGRERFTSRAARRKAMRDADIPTSQQPVSQSRNQSGREYSYDTPVPGGGTQRKSVQQQTMDRSHPGQSHWEAGRVKTDPLTGAVRKNKYGRPALTNDKSKVDY